MKAFADALLAAFLPFRCLLCNGAAEGMDLCAGCLDDLPWLSRACPRCARPGSPRTCAACTRRPPVFGRCLAALIYEYPVDRLVPALKFRGGREYARPLGEVLLIAVLEMLRESPEPLPDLVVPVPLHRTRLIERGYNQAELLARPVATALGCPLRPAALRRVRRTPAQMELRREARLGNLRNAFLAPRTLDGLRVALVDDVYTTGTTTTEAARTLLSAGAARVDVWVLARTPE